MHPSETLSGQPARPLAAQGCGCGKPHPVPEPNPLAHPDWYRAPVEALIPYLLEQFHAKHRRQFPHLIQLALRVEQTHGAHPACPAGLADQLVQMQQELESHMLKEEQILFPLLLQGLRGDALQGPIQVMLLEHDQHGTALARLAALTGDLQLPPEACHSWRSLYAGLDELCTDLRQHIRLENEGLFQQALGGAA